MLTEVGELADAFKKYMAYGKDVDWVNVEEEAGDLLWYIAGFFEFNNISMSHILRQNIAKLESRYPEKFTEDKAIHRDLDAERSILESNE